MVRSLDDAARAALEEAIRDVEARSSAEIVLAIRSRTGSYLHVYLAVALAAALAMLAFLLYSRWEFSLLAILTFPAVAALAAGLLVSAVPPLVRLLTPASARRRRLHHAARATFVDKRVHQTRGRTGVLVYVSWLERAAEVVPDVGIEAQVEPASWQEATAEVDRAAARGRDVPALAAAIRALGDALAPNLPHAFDDVNELPDAVVHVP